MSRPIVTLLTDFGTADHYAAAMKGVTLCICPDARLVDISHEVTPFAIAEAAYTLAQAWRVFPKGRFMWWWWTRGWGARGGPFWRKRAGICLWRRITGC